MPLSDRLAARRGESSQSNHEWAPEVRDYEAHANELADRVSRLGAFRGHQDRARILRQLTEIDQRVHSLLEFVGDRQPRGNAGRGPQDR